MSNPLARLKLLMGGDEAFKAAEANATKPQNNGPQFQGTLLKTDTLKAHHTELEPRTVPGYATAESILKEARKWTKPTHSNNSSDSNKQSWCSALRRAQRYLGFREPNQTRIPQLAYTQSLPHRPDLDPIILSLDIEADEQNHSLITEIGIATLDTRSLKTLTPGPNGKHWLAQVRAQHFRIAERTYIRNHIFVTGDPESFNAEFGTSQIIPLDQIAGAVRACFLQKQDDEDDYSNSSSKPPASPLPLRNVLLIGHNIKSDIAWLRQLGVDLLSIPNLIEVLDTEELQKALKLDSQGGTNLARLLLEMDIEAWSLHNAGNDAAYTLQAFIAITLKSLSDARPIVTLEERVKEAVAKATEKATADWKAWVTAEERSGDGETPVAYRLSKFRA